MSTFHAFHERLQRAIVHRLGWATLRPVQDEAGAALLAGHNAVILAPTAGGKTEASMFPALSMLLEAPPAGVGAIYIAPIKALLNNQAERLGTYTEMVGFDRFVWHGDTTPGAKRRFIDDPCALLMTTPESLEVMLASSRVPVGTLFGDLRIIILDEVHALAGTDRGAHLMSVLERIARHARGDVQRVGLSATIGNPEAILTWMQGTSQRQGVVVDPPKPPAARELWVEYDEDDRVLSDLAAQRARGVKSLFFCESRAVSEATAEQMRKRGTEVYVHHSSVSYEERAEAEARFHRGSNTCIVCTSTLELGIDVGDLDRVLQLDAPSSVSAFLQRMGRTGRRAGSTANMTFYTADDEAVLQAAALIELARRGWVERVPVQSRCWPVLVHQLLAMCLGQGSIRADDAWEVLHRVPDFAGITRAEFDAVVHHMRTEQYLFASDGLLAMGDQAERAFGRKHFMELYAVFSTPQLYVVRTAHGRELGSLEQQFVDRLAETGSTFLLAGRPWQVHGIDHAAREVRVGHAPAGAKPTWGGLAPRFLSAALAGAIRDILRVETTLPYLSPKAAARLDVWRDSLHDLLQVGPCPVAESDSVLQWWTFGGGRINTTLKYALEALLDVRLLGGNLGLRAASGTLDARALDDAVTQLANPRVWDDGLRQVVQDRCPEYRLSKFQRALPPWAQQEMVQSFLLDIPGAQRVALGRVEGWRAHRGEVS